MNYTPDPKLHLVISIIKSIIRIAAGGCLAYQLFLAAGLLIILAEVLGIIEECV